MLGPFLEIRLTDVVDILFVTVLVSTVIAWVRRTQAFLVATGIVIFGFVYLAARALGLQLTQWLFQGFFAIFVIIIVVIFQEELRQLFERLAVFGLRRRRRRVETSSEASDVLVQCLTEFARDRVGALVVLPGTQPIQRHIQGGIELQGRLSLPLLKSIFDHHSPGHDGAVIVEGPRITRFAAHLPLSRDFPQLARVGTRHSAALGLAELTDALCLVVSEERGTISVAHDGRLREMARLEDVGGEIGRFLAGRRHEPRRATWVRVLRENWAERLVSLVLVLGLWYLFVPGSRPTVVTYDVPVRITNLPVQYVIERVEPQAVRVTFEGPTRAFYLFDSGALAVTIDASLARAGRRTFEITEENVEHPTNLRLEAVDPSRVRISVAPAPDGAEGGTENRGS